jgi:guanylate kinase
VAAARRGIPFVISAPSGAGKTTVCRAVVDCDPGIVHSVSHTTRPPRAGEEDGVHYHFVGEAEFRDLAHKGAFLEWAQYGSHLYGTSVRQLDDALDRGVDVLLEIDVQGAEQIRERRAEARLIFLVPPSREELERRLRGRGTDGPEVVERRLRLVGRELAAARLFDYVVVNDDLERAIAGVREILDAERGGWTEAVRQRLGREAALERFGPGFDNLW